MNLFLSGYALFVHGNPIVDRYDVVMLHKLLLNEIGLGWDDLIAWCKIGENARCKTTNVKT